MAMKLTSTGGVKVSVLQRFLHALQTATWTDTDASCYLQVYNVTSTKSMPDWLKGKTKGSLRKDEEYRHAPLLQHLLHLSFCLL